MIEFTLSRVTLCVCGVILLVSVTAVIQGVYDNDRSEDDDHLVQRIGYILDVFESSDVDELILDGSTILPSGYFLVVHDGFAELSDGEKKHIAMTSYNGEFRLEYDGVEVITHRRSLRSSLQSR